MSGEWDSVPLDSLIQDGKGISYGIVQPGSHVDDGVPIVRVTDVRDGRIATHSPLKVSKEIEASYSRTRLKGGELLLTLVGTVGEVAIVPQEMAGWNVARAVAVIPVKEDIGPYWISLALRSPLVRQVIDSRLNTTVQATLNLGDVSKLPIPLPAKAEREAISHIVGSLESKIELNRKMNETLESMARALFKSWFIDFDPVRAKMDGRWKKGQSLPGLPAELWDLFPSQLAKCEHGELPEGWSFRTLAQSSEVVMGQSPPGESYNETGEGVVFYQGRAEFGFRYPSPRLYCTEPTRFAERGAILLSVRAPVGDLNIADQRMAIGRGLAAIKHRQGGQSFTYYLLKGASNFFEVFDGEGTVFGSINKDALAGMKHIEPSAAILAKYLQIVEPIDGRIEDAEIASKILSKTRDSLLPRLISGELKLGDASRFLQERRL